MFSEYHSLKTNEVLRRRKLRLQQVREQSKEIAKTIRDRASIQKYKQIINIDAQKEKEYLQKQENIVKQLEELYSKGMQNIGAGHKSATDLNRDQENIPPALDLSRKRGREAAAILRKEKEEKLLQQKTMLDRKLMARELANVKSREKSKANIKSKPIELLNKSAQVTIDDQKPEPPAPVRSEKADTATQWQDEEVELVIPTLKITESKENVNEDRPIHRDLFALSEEMASIAGSNNVDEFSKPSLSLVSHHLQNRNLKLRETVAPKVPLKKSELMSIRQTIQQTRAAKGDAKNVLEGIVPPLPIWKAHTPEFSVSKDQLINLNSSCLHHNTPVLSLDKLCTDTEYSINDMSSKAKFSKTVNNLNKKSSVTIYDHSTRGSGETPAKLNLVSVASPEEDAYAQASKITPGDNTDLLKMQIMRNKAAMTRAKVEKEYKETMDFLNSLPKENMPKCVKKAFMSDSRKHQLKDKHQKEMEEELNKIESLMHRKHCAKSRHRWESVQSNDNLYTWMPVPETEAAMAVHTIPTMAPKEKANVKFTDEAKYHQYRTRHKHTPPTRESESVNTLIEDISPTSSDMNTVDHDSDEKIIVYKVVNKARARSKSRRLNEELKAADKVEVAAKTQEQTPFVDTRGETQASNTEVKSNTNKTNLDEFKRGSSTIQWDGGDASTCERLIKEQSQEKVDTQNAQVVAQPLTSSSASSLRNPNEIKEDCRNSPFMEKLKMMNEAKENGNFYVGASGFLKDQDYEVIIQLRKKDLNKPMESPKDPPLTKDQSINTSNDSQENKIENGAQTVIENEKKHVSVETVLIKEDSKDFAQSTESQPCLNKVSVETQTTLNSPRPVIHVSSSNSTAYMSPPEIVLPKSMKSKLRQTKQKTNIEENHCNKKKCKNSKDNSRSATSSKPKKAKKKGRKCSSNSSSNGKSFTNISSRNQSAKKPVKSKEIINNVYRYCDDRNTSRKANINPSVKRYINKLLEINNKMNRPMHIANEDCSSVTTPGSSIINVEHNIKENKDDYRENLLEQIKALINPTNCQKNQHSFTEKSSGSQNKKNYHKYQQQLSKKKTTHKVKALNISKNLLRSNEKEPVELKNSCTSPVRTSESLEKEIQPVITINLVDNRKADKELTHVAQQPKQQSNENIHTSHSPDHQSSKKAIKELIKLKTSEQKKNMDIIASQTKTNVNNLINILEELRKHNSMTKTRMNLDLVSAKEKNVTAENSTENNAASKINSHKISDTSSKSVVQDHVPNLLASIYKPDEKIVEILEGPSKRKLSFIPHELSTVTEIDSPMSAKLKSSENSRDNSTAKNVSNSKTGKTNKNGEVSILPCLLDAEKINDIRMQSFLKIDDYVKQFGENLTNLQDDISQNSEVCLPNIEAELLKRNLISEPFESPKHINSTSISDSSQSALTPLILSSILSCRLQSKRKNLDSSDTSNADVKMVLKKVGMAQASSTLKKTKGNYSFSSSTTSESSSSTYRDQITPKRSVKRRSSKTNIQSVKEVELQTSITNNNCMSVKQFLTQLSDKITFTKSGNVTDEFKTLCETRMPPEMQQISNLEREERSIDSCSNVNRRTSTPVQVLKTNTYYSSSSSNNVNGSNGLFSNMDDLSSVKVTSSSTKNHSASDKDDLNIPNYSLRKKKEQSDLNSA